MPLMSSTTHYNVIIIGAGTLAHQLAQSGKNMLFLERSGYWKRLKLKVLKYKTSLQARSFFFIRE